MNTTVTMLKEAEDGAGFASFFVLSRDPRQRATITRTMSEIGYAVPLEDEVELVQHWPNGSAVLLVHDVDGAVGRVIGLLEQRAEWLPIVALDEAPSVMQVVDALHAGAVDYWQLPIDDRVARQRLVRAFRQTRANRARLEARAKARKRLSGLTPREREVFECVTFGYTNKEIARSLGISPRTVEIHRANAKKALSANSSAEVVRLGFEAEFD